MDRKQIVELLRDLAAGPMVYGVVGPIGLKALSEAADLLEADGWVSVGERLPEPRQDVLVAAYFDDGDFAIVTAYMEPDVGWISVDGGNDLDQVAHWRPLPTPPGGDHD